MTVTVAGLNYTQIDDCETVDYNDAAGVDAGNFKEGSNSAYWKLRGTGASDATFTPVSSVDMSTDTILRFWGLFAQGSYMDLAPDGLQIGITDGTNTGWWDLGGRDTYPGGWYNFVVDVSLAVDSGTKPTAMNAITEIYVRINQTGTAKNTDNTWIDNLCLCDGLSAYGDDGGSYFDIEDIYQQDLDPTVLGIGVLRKIGGVYFATGEFETGDSAGSSATKFQAKNQSLVFEDRNIRATLYNITVVDNGTGTTEFLLGEKSGTAGISGCTIQVEDTAQVPVFDLIATDTDISNFGMYGTTFLGADDILLPADSTITEVINCSFNACGQVDPSTCTMFNCNFVSSTATGTGALLLDSTTFNVTYCSFIACTYGVQITAAGDYDAYGITFTGTVTADLNNTSGGAVVWANIAGTGSNAATETGDTTIESNVIITITVKDNADFGLLENARVLVQCAAGGDLPGDASVNITSSGTTASVAHTDHGMVNGDIVNIEGALEGQYNGVHTISNVTTNAYDYTMSGDPASPATGTITSSYVLVYELTNASGIASEGLNYTTDQPITGRVRLYGATKYVTGRIAGDVVVTGFDQTVLLVEEI